MINAPTSDLPVAISLLARLVHIAYAQLVLTYLGSDERLISVDQLVGFSDPERLGVPRALSWSKHFVDHPQVTSLGAQDQLSLRREGNHLNATWFVMASIAVIFS